MIPMRHSTIFRSRWWALLWAGGILWSAVEFASSDEAVAPGGNDQAANGSADPSNQDPAALLKQVG